MKRISNTHKEVPADLLPLLQVSTLPSEQRADTSAWGSPAEANHLLYVKGGAGHPYCAPSLLWQRGGQVRVQSGGEGEVGASSLSLLQESVSIL